MSISGHLQCTSSAFLSLGAVYVSVLKVIAMEKHLNKHFRMCVPPCPRFFDTRPVDSVWVRSTCIQFSRELNVPIVRNSQ